MLNKNEVPMTGQVEVFNFSQEKTPIRVQLINSEPWFVVKDVCEVLEHSNHKMAVKSLDEDEVSSVYLIDAIGRKQETKIVSESGLYSLIFQSRKPEAKKFRKWVTAEVLPSIRKKGYYGIKKVDGDYLDARDVPYRRAKYQDGEIRVIEVDGVKWYSLNDIHSCIGSRTESCQSVKRLNAKRTLAKKIWIYGVTQPGWFVCELGVRLLLCASVKHQESRQLMLDFSGKEG